MRSPIFFTISSIDHILWDILFSIYFSSVWWVQIFKNSPKIQKWTLAAENLVLGFFDMGSFKLTKFCWNRSRTVEKVSLLDMAFETYRYSFQYLIVSLLISFFCFTNNSRIPFILQKICLKRTHCNRFFFVRGGKSYTTLNWLYFILS